MNLNILTSGMITAKFGIRPALMCATRKDLSAHSVVRIVSDNASGWIGIAYGHLITGAKCQKGDETINGFEALSAFMKLENGVFDLIQMDNSLLGDELAQSIGISIDELLEQLKNNPTATTIEILRKCRRTNDAITMLMQTEANSAPRSPLGKTKEDVTDGDEEDLDWELGEDGVIDSLEPQTRVGRKKSSESEILLFASDEIAAELPDEADGPLLHVPAEEELRSASAFESENTLAKAPQVQAYDPDQTVDRVPVYEEKKAVPVAEFPLELTFVPKTDPQPEEASDPLARIVELSKNQEAAFDIGSIEKVESKQNTSFVLLSPGESAENQPIAAPALISEERKDLLGEDLRRELQEFVKQKFGVEEDFKQVDIEESKDYQASLVLRDLERSIEKARGDEPVRKPTSAVEKPVVPDVPEGRSTLQKLKSQAQIQGQSQSSTGLRSTGSRPKPSTSTSKEEDERESSRNLFTEQMRKSVEVDAKSFISNQSTDSKLELSILKDKRLRSIIIVAASVGIVLAGGILVFFTTERQSSLQSASKKLLAQDLPGAKEAYERILQQNPQSWEAHLGHALSVPDDLKQQVKDYKQVLAIKPDEFSAATALSKAYFELNEYDKAIGAAELAYKLKPNPTSLKIKASSLIKLSRFDDASKVLMEALELNSSNKAELHYMLSGCFREMKNPDGQSACLNKALEIEPRNPIYAKEIAMLEIARKGSKGKGKEFLERAIAVTPGDGELRYQRALLIKDKSPGEAIEELTHAIGHGYDRPEAHAERGMLYFANRKYGPAKPDLEDALEKKDNPKWRRVLDATDKAIRTANTRAGGTRQLPDDSPDELPVSELTGDYWSKANSSIQSGNAGYAIRLMKAALRQNPNDARARRILAVACFNAGEYVGAANQFAYFAAQPMSAEEQYMYGKSLSKANRLETAIEVLRRLLRSQPNYTQARVELIKAYSLAGFRDHAREECQIGMQQSRTQTDYMQFKSLLP